MNMAAGLGRLGPRCIIHTHRGSEYASIRLRTGIGDLNLLQSMDRIGVCYENAAAESFFAEAPGVPWPGPGPRAWGKARRV
jgi:transposase InsO family protein